MRPSTGSAGEQTPHRIDLAGVLRGRHGVRHRRTASAEADHLRAQHREPGRGQLAGQAAMEVVDVRPRVDQRVHAARAVPGDRDDGRVEAARCRWGEHPARDVAIVSGQRDQLRFAVADGLLGEDQLTVGPIGRQHEQVGQPPGRCCSPFREGGRGSVARRTEPTRRRGTPRCCPFRGDRGASCGFRSDISRTAYDRGPGRSSERGQVGVTSKIAF